MQYVITIQYDGTRYHGWQRLSNCNDTIQFIIETALSSYFHESIRIHGSGRTDAGVHALEQYADFKCNARLNFSDIHTFLKEINELLPSDIAIRTIVPAASSYKANPFHARKSAVSKTYSYYISLSQKTSPFYRRYCYQLTDAPLLVSPTIFEHLSDSEFLESVMNRMRICARHLIGTMDYSAFTTDKSKEKSHIRTIESIELELLSPNDSFMNESILRIRITGDAFLYNMVRIISGTIISCGLGIMEPEQIPTIIQCHTRSNSGPTLPSNALFLTSVRYDTFD